MSRLRRRQAVSRAPGRAGAAAVGLLLLLGAAGSHAAQLLVHFALEETSWSGAPGELVDSGPLGLDGRVVRGATPETAAPAIAGSPGTCGYAALSSGQLLAERLPVSMARGAKTTVAFWMNWSGANNMMPFGWDSHDLWLFNGSFGFNTGNGDIYGIASGGLAGGWHHVVAEFTNGDVTANRLYIDGVEQTLTQRRRTPDNNRAVVQREARIGGWGRSTGYRFSGGIDEFKVFDGALSAAEVNALVNDTHPCPVPPPPPPGQLLVHYQFEEPAWSGAAGEIVDAGPLGLDGRLIANGVPATATPAIAGATGTCGYAQLSRGQLLAPGLPVSTARGARTTVAFWMNWSGADNMMPFGWNSHDLWLRSGSFGFNTSSGDIYGIASAGLAGGWHHVVAEFTNGDVTANRLYIDGVEQTLTQRRGRPNNGRAVVQSDAHVGGWGRSSGYRFDGGIDEFKVFDGVLTAAEINALVSETHPCPVPPPPSQLLLHLPFEDAAWTGAPGEVTDISGNDHHGTVLANATPVDTAPAIAGSPGTCGYAELRRGEIQVPGLPVETRSGAKTTVAFWMNWSGTNNMMAMGWRVHDLWFFNGAFGFNSGAGDIYGIDSAGLAGAWHHVVAEFTNGNLTANRLFIDGVEQVLSQRRGRPNNARAVVQSDLRIGDWAINDGYRFVGDLDEFMVYRGTLTDAEIRDLAAATHPCSGAPVLELRMDEASWTGAPDEVLDAASGVHGTAQGGVTTASASPVVPGNPGTCRYGEFDGRDDHVLVPHDAVLNGTDALTYAAWVRPRQRGGVQQIMAKSVHGGGSGRAQMGLFVQGNRLILRAETDAGRVEASTRAPDLDVWTHVAGVFAGQRLDLYVDGALADTQSFGPRTLVQTTDPLAISKRVGTNQYFFEGSIDEVRVYNVALDQAAVQSAMSETRPCSLPPIAAASAFRVTHDGAGIHCVDEPVTVSVLDGAGTVLTDYDGRIDLATSTARGTWVLLSGNGAFSDPVADDGAASYQFDSSDGGSVRFALSYREGPALVDVDVFESGNPGVRDTDTEGPITFAPSGFTVTGNALPNPPPSPIDDPVATQHAGVNAAFPVHLSAYGVTADDPVCGVIESYDGDANLRFTMTHVNPGSGGRLATVDDVPVNGGTQPVTFNAGQAVVTVAYKDAGRIRLGVEDAGSFANVLSGASNDFVVQPAELTITRIQSAAGVDNPGAGSATGLPFVPAGEAFEVDVEARDADGDLTPNYGLEAPAEGIRVVSEILVVPSPGGRNGSTGDVIDGAAFVPAGVPGRFTNTRVVFDEVGVIRLRPATADGDYLGSGAVAGLLSGPVGRFHPASFELLGDVVDAGCGSFTYMDQDALGLEFVLQALTVGGTVTENYDSALLGAPAVAGYAVTAENADDAVDRGGRLTAPGAAWQDGEVVVDRSDLMFARNGLPDGPFESLQLGLAVTDPLGDTVLANLDGNPTTSGDCTVAGDCSVGLLGAATAVVYGRLVVLPANGPENEDLDIPLVAQRFTGGAFESQPADACTPYRAADVSLSDWTGNLTAADTSVIAPAGTATLIGGASDPDDPVTLAAPDFGHEGTVRVTVDVPAWLEFDWQGSGPEDPAGTAAFGRFRGHDRIIFWGEQR